MTKESLNRAAGGRCIAAGRWYAKASTIVPGPPMGSRGRGPWSGRGSQRVKPRLVSPFEKRRLFCKGQKFLRVVCPKAGFYHLKWQRPKVGDPSNRCLRQLRRDDSYMESSGFQGSSGRGVLPCLSSRASETSRGISNPEPLLPWMAGPCLGADHTKESLSFAKQPSPFKGRNQSWFHPLRTPSRPGAAAPGPHGGQRAIGGFFAYHLPAARHRPPAARS